MNCFTTLAAELRDISGTAGALGLNRANATLNAAAALAVLNPDVADCALVLTRAESWCPPGWIAEMGSYGSVSLKRPGGAWTSIRRTSGAWRTADGHLCATFPEALEHVLEAEAARR